MSLEGGFDGPDDVPGYIVLQGYLAQNAGLESTGGNRVLAKHTWKCLRDEGYLLWKERKVVI
jgi:hypothetical protein